MAVYTVTLKDEVSAPAAKAEKSTKSLAGGMNKLKEKTEGLVPKNKLLADKAKGMTSEFQKNFAASKALDSMMGSLGSVLNPVTVGVTAIGVAAAAMTAFVIGAAAGIYHLVAAAVAVAQTRTRLVNTFDAFTKGGGDKAIAGLEELSKKLPYSAGQITEWGKSLVQAGVRDTKAMQRGVMAAAAASAIMGDKTGAVGQQVSKTLGELHLKAQRRMAVPVDDAMIGKLAEMGLTIEDISAQLKRGPMHLRHFGASAKQMGEAIQNALALKGGKALHDLTLEWDVIKSKLTDGFAAMFDGMDFKPLMYEVKSLFKEFFRGGEGAKVWGPILTGGIKGVMEMAKVAVRAIHIGFLEAEIAVLKLAIALAPTVKLIKRMWENGGAERFVTMLKGLGIVALGIGVAFGAVVGSTLAVIGAIGLLVGTIASIVGWVLEAIGTATGVLSGWATSAYEAASNFVGGIVSGIKAGVGRVVQAVKDLAASAVGAFTGPLVIKSPSGLMREKGMQVPAGAALGIEDGTPKVAEASRGMAEAAAGGGGAGAPGGGGRAITINFASGAINISGAGSNGEALSLTEEGLALVFERIALNWGLSTT